MGVIESGGSKGEVYMYDTDIWTGVCKLGWCDAAAGLHVVMLRGSLT